MEQVKASEVVAELRRMARTYELFKRAEEMVQVLVEFEARKRELEKDLAQEFKRRDDLELAVAQAKDKYEEDAKAAKKRLAAMEEQIVQNQKVADEVMKKAREQAEWLVWSAKQNVEKIKMTIADLKKEEEAARRGADVAKQALQDFTTELRMKKEQLLKAFN